MIGYSLSYTNYKNDSPNLSDGTFVLTKTIAPAGIIRMRLQDIHHGVTEDTEILY